MDPRLYRAAELDDWDVIKQFEQELDIQQTPTKDTILHILSRFSDSSFSVERILQSKPEMLLKLNAQKETSLHIAARMGNLNVVYAIIDCIERHKNLRSVLRSRNVLGNLALHEAIRSKRREIIRLLLENDPFRITFRNSAYKSPLYLAAEKGDEFVVALILSTIKHLPLAFRSKKGRLFYSGPGGKTALHAAAIWNSRECLKLILLELPHLTKKVDRYGWNALHYAAKFNHQEVAGLLLEKDRSMGYVNTNKIYRTSDVVRIPFLNALFRNDGGKTALHVAVTCGNIQVLEEILAYCPDCWSMVTNMGKNAIHLAVKNEQQGVLDFILRKSWASELVNSRDAMGQTPLHLYIDTKKLLGHELVSHLGVEINSLNKNRLTPLDLLKDADQDQERHDFLKRELEEAGARSNRSPNIVSIEKNLVQTREHREEKLSRMAESYQVVATLIITICFGATFTIPGGYESNDSLRKGLPIFLKRPAFIAYIVSNILAMWFALGALLNLLLPFGREGQKYMFIRLRTCRRRIALAIIALVISFVTGLFVALPNLGIRICLLYFVSVLGLGVLLNHYLPI